MKGDRKLFRAAVHMAAIVITTASLLYQFAQAAAQTTPEVKLPDTPAGRRVAAYFDAFNSGDEKAMVKFFTENLAESSLKNRTMEDRLSIYRQIRSDLGKVELQQALEAKDNFVKVFAKGGNGEFFEYYFDFEPQPPNKLVGIRVEHIENPGDYQEPAANKKIIQGNAQGGSKVVKLPAFNKSGVAKKLDEYLSRMAAFGFSGAVLVAKDGEIVFSRGYGMADRAGGIANTPDTVFDVGSVAKQFTAAAILKLEMMGKLNTSDSISKCLDTVPADKQAITIHHLLTHTSGLMPAPGFERGETFDDRDKRVKQILGAPLGYQPGERFLYSNAGYNIAAAIIEKVSGQMFEQFLYEQLFKPAGMTATGFVAARFKVPGFDKRRVARLYVGEEDNGVPYGRSNLAWFLIGPGGILTTTGDLFKWQMALMGNRVLSAEARKKFFEPSLNNYAYGWSVRDTPNGKLTTHSGGTTTGVGAAVMHYVDAGIFIALGMNNSGEEFNRLISRGVSGIAFGRDEAMPPAVLSTAPADISKYAGAYALVSGGTLTATVAGGRLKIAADSREGLAALFSSGQSERYRKLEADTAKIVEALLKEDYAPLHEGYGRRMPIEKLIERERRFAQANRARFGELKGYKIIGTTPEPQDDAAVNVRLEFERGRIYLQYVWVPRGIDVVRALEEGPGLVFLPASATEFISYQPTTGKIARVAFSSNSAGEITGLTLTAGNAQSVVANKAR